MTIAEVREKCKGYLAKTPRDMLVIAILVLASSASFGLGFLAGRDAGQGSRATLDIPSSAAPGTVGQVVASKSGTKYYFPECTGAKAISEQNKVWFVSASAASEAGYTLASSCKGN